jgi:hypothetical protein
MPYTAYPQPLKGKTFSGARAIFLVNGAAVAFARSTSGEEMIDYEPVDVLTVLEVAEHVPVAYRTSLSASMFRLVGESIKKNKIMPRLEDVLTSGEMEAAIQDVVSQNTMYLFTGVRCSGRTWQIDARGIVAEEITFATIRVLDESEN